MPPQSNPNWRHLEEYEQIKRKNRRRLVGALLLTTVVALLLAKVMGSSKNTAAPGEITVQCLEGRVQFEAAGQTHAMQAGDFLWLPAGEPDALRAEADASLLVTVSLPQP